MVGVKKRGFILLMVLLTLITQLSGCAWNYRDIEKLQIVAGMAIDRAEDGKFKVTFEIVDIETGGRNSTVMSSLQLTSVGETIFDAARNSIKVSGNRLYFSQMEIVIISKELAQEGIVPILDFLNRDGEPRHDMEILISTGEAATIFEESEASSSDIISYILGDTLRSEKGLSKAPKVQLWQLLNEISSDDVAASVPLVAIKTVGGKLLPEISGAGVFKGDKMVDTLNEEETKMLHFIKNNVGGGMIVVYGLYPDKGKKVALEIFGNKTKMKPSYEEGMITMEISITTQVAIGENMGEEDFNTEEGMEKLAAAAENELEMNIEKLVEKAQNEFHSDIFGFGKEVRVHMPIVWESVKDDWEEIFLLVKVKVDVKMQIKNSGFVSKPIKVGI